MLIKIGKAVLIIISFIIIGYEGFELIKKINDFKMQTIEGVVNTKTIFALILSILILVLSLRLKIVFISSISILASFLCLANSIGIVVINFLGETYVNSVLTQKSFIEFTYEGAMQNFKLITYLLSIMLILLWLRIVLVLRHKFIESG